MKKIILFLLVVFSIFSILFSYPYPYPLTHEMTPQEASIKDFNKDFYETNPPQGPVRNIAEFDKMEGVLVRYHFGIPISLIADMSQDTKVTTIVANQSEQNTVLSIYNANNVNIANCNFLIAPTDSYWTRDYGPWYIADSQNNIAIVNFPYNRPLRPNDNDIPIRMSEFLGIDLYGMNVVHTGGNYMTDGLGFSASTQLVWDENPNLTHEEINQKMHDYLGIDTYYVVQDPNSSDIDHIDCWGKYLATDKILIRSVPTYHPQYDEIEQTANYFSTHNSSYGTPYRVYRVYTPNNEPYTNSLILNNKVYVPVVNSSYDDDAIITYQEAMPGYEIVPVEEDPSHPWESTDALHCRTKGIADRNMLYIKHLPIVGNVQINQDYQISADIIPYSGQSVVAESTKVFYKTDNGNYQSLDMTLQSGNTYIATIPAQAEGSDVYYYIHSVDQAGNSANLPFIGAPDPFHFHVGQPVPPNLVVNPLQFNLNMSLNQTITQNLSLTNSGEGEINYTIDIQEVDRNRSIEGSQVTMEISEFSPGQTYNVIVSVNNASSDQEWLTDVTLQFPSGVTVNSSTDLEGGSSPLTTDNATGDGATIHWYDADQGYGNIYNGEIATATVNFTVSSDFSSDMVLNYSITGDQWGDEPHYIEGTITLTNMGEPITWISVSQSSGTLGENETDDIDVIFDTHNVGTGTYTANIIITDDRRNETIIPVTLIVASDDVLNDELVSIKSISYPNPFVIGNEKRNTVCIKFKNLQKSNELLNIFNIKGQLVKELKLKDNVVVWDLKNNNGKIVSPGIYFYMIKDRKDKKTGKIILLK